MYLHWQSYHSYRKNISCNFYRHAIQHNDYNSHILEAVHDDCKYCINSLSPNIVVLNENYWSLQLTCVWVDWESSYGECPWLGSSPGLDCLAHVSVAQVGECALCQIALLHVQLFLLGPVPQPGHILFMAVSEAQESKQKYIQGLLHVPSQVWTVTSS